MIIKISYNKNILPLPRVSSTAVVSASDNTLDGVVNNSKVTDYYVKKFLNSLTLNYVMTDFKIYHSKPVVLSFHDSSFILPSNDEDSFFSLANNIKPRLLLENKDNRELTPPSVLFNEGNSGVSKPYIPLLFNEGNSGASLPGNILPFISNNASSLSPSIENPSTLLPLDYNDFKDNLSEDFFKELVGFLVKNELNFDDIMEYIIFDKYSPDLNNSGEFIKVLRSNKHGKSPFEPYNSRVYHSQKIIVFKFYNNKSYYPYRLAEARPWTEKSIFYHNNDLKRNDYSTPDLIKYKLSEFRFGESRPTTYNNIKWFIKSKDDIFLEIPWEKLSPYPVLFNHCLDSTYTDENAETIQKLLSTNLKSNLDNLNLIKNKLTTEFFKEAENLFIKCPSLGIIDKDCLIFINNMHYDLPNLGTKKINFDGFFYKHKNTSGHYSYNGPNALKRNNYYPNLFLLANNITEAWEGKAFIETPWKLLPQSRGLIQQGLIVERAPQQVQLNIDNSNSSYNIPFDLDPDKFD